MAAVSIDESKRIITHAINNRLNTLSLGISFLENKSTPETKSILRSLKMELRDLEELIQQLRHHNL